jgi:hypothetical protein
LSPREKVCQEPRNRRVGRIAGMAIGKRLCAIDGRVVYVECRVTFVVLDEHVDVRTLKQQ